MARRDPDDDDEPINTTARRRPGVPVALIVAGVVALGVLLVVGGAVAVVLANAGKGGGVAIGAETWTPRDLVAHLNKGKQGQPYRIVSLGDRTFIGEEDSEKDDGDHQLDAMFNDGEYVEVSRMASTEAARLGVGEKEPGRVWRWNQFVFTAPDANGGVSGQIKKALGVTR